MREHDLEGSPGPRQARRQAWQGTTKGRAPRVSHSEPVADAPEAAAAATRARHEKQQRPRRVHGRVAAYSELDEEGGPEDEGLRRPARDRFTSGDLSMDTSPFAEVRALTDNLGINLHEALFAAPPAKPWSPSTPEASLGSSSHFSLPPCTSPPYPSAEPDLRLASDALSSTWAGDMHSEDASHGMWDRPPSLASIGPMLEDLARDVGGLHGGLALPSAAPHSHWPPPPLYPPEPGVEFAAELNGAWAEAESNVPGVEGAESALAVGDYVKVVEALARQCPDTRGVKFRIDRFKDSTRAYCSSRYPYPRTPIRHPRCEERRVCKVTARAAPRAVDGGGRGRRYAPIEPYTHADYSL